MTTDPVPSSGAPEPTPADVTAVIVTYGDRRALLMQVLERLRDEGVGHVVIVDNGARWMVAAETSARFGSWAEVVSMGGNLGSARGFIAGLEAAMRSGSPFLWVLDDDNRPRPGCLAILCKAYEEEAARTPGGLTAVAALRAEHFAGRVSARQLMTRWDSFGGFHVADVVAKLVQRLPVPSAPARRRRLGVAPYGGMLFHRSLVERVGLPLAEFCQYGDDTEFTWRVTRMGGRIVQIANAEVEDLDAAFQKNTQLRNRFLGALLADSDFRTYYTFRNLAYFEDRFRRRNRALFALNRTIYFAILRHYARRLDRLERYRFIRASAEEGLSGRLGQSDRFPLF